MTSRPAPVVQAILFSGLALAFTFMNLAPLQLDAGGMALPDLLLAMAVAWSIRQPEAMPLLLTAAVLVMADLILDRPAGLWALISLLIVEATRAQREGLRSRPFPFEWMAFAAMLAAGMLAQSLILTIALVDRPAGPESLQLYAMTVVGYPLVVALLHYLLRVRSPRPAERSRRLGRVA